MKIHRSSTGHACHPPTVPYTEQFAQKDNLFFVHLWWVDDWWWWQGSIYYNTQWHSINVYCSSYLTNDCLVCRFSACWTQVRDAHKQCRTIACSSKDGRMVGCADVEYISCHTMFPYQFLGAERWEKSTSQQNHIHNFVCVVYKNCNFGTFYLFNFFVLCLHRCATVRYKKYERTEKLNGMDKCDGCISHSPTSTKWKMSNCRRIRPHEGFRHICVKRQRPHNTLNTIWSSIK